jgi:hypothetical protein
VDVQTATPSIQDFHRSSRQLVMRGRRGAPAIELYKACSGANDGPWRQSGVLQEPRVQLLHGLDAPIDDRPRCRRRGKVSGFIRCGSAKPVANYYEAVRPSPAHRYFRPRGFAACALYGVYVVKRFQRGDLSCFLDRFLCSTGKPVSSSRPAVLQSRRAQELSRLAVAPTFPRALRLPGHTLTAPSTLARSMGSG